MEEHSDDKERYQSADRALKVLKREIERNPFMPFAVVVVLFIAGVILHIEVFHQSIEALECLFTGLAFAGVVITLWYQRQEMELQREEMRLQRTEMERQQKEMHTSATALMRASYLDALAIYMQNLQIRIGFANDANIPEALRLKYGTLLREAEVMLERFRWEVIRGMPEEITWKVYIGFDQLAVLVTHFYGNAPSEMSSALLLATFEPLSQMSQEMAETPVLSVEERLLWRSLYVATHDVEELLIENAKEPELNEQCWGRYSRCVEALNDVGMKLPNATSAVVKDGKVMVRCVAINLTPSNSDSSQSPTTSTT